ncbi:unnamed protein product [Tilletia caries]|uniref:Uncharacterized protein n=1 Tax=Tilletia caries TaxID=13290 RepID=A0ABN7IX00_9BASI|nr:unnamed protein product [Tilletia caries]
MQDRRRNIVRGGEGLDVVQFARGNELDDERGADEEGCDEEGAEATAMEGVAVGEGVEDDGAVQTEHGCLGDRVAA